MPNRILTTEFTRLAALYRYGILDTPREIVFDAILHDLAAELRVPVAQLAFGDAQRWWIKSAVGPAASESLRGGTLADLVLSDHARLLVPDALAEGRVAGDLPAADEPLRSYAAIRINSHEGDPIGLIQVADTGRRAFTTAEAAAIESAAHGVSALLESRRRAQLDAETGALARAAFEESLRLMVEAMRGSRQRLSLVRFDLAVLSAGLEAMGTGLGRIALRRMADIGAHHVRRRDSFGRLTEDCFAVLLTDTGETGARILAERLSKQLLQGWSGTLPSLGSIAIHIASVKPMPGDESIRALGATLGPQRPEVPVPALLRA